MSEKAYQSDVTELKKILRSHSIQPSHHRLQVLSYLKNHRVHPTADMIYQHISAKIHTLSKTTVYNTLKIFSEKGIVRELNIGEHELRYDINVEPHAHFKCVKCGKLFDVFDKTLLPDREMVDGHIVSKIDVYLQGTCKECAGKEQYRSP